MLGHEDPRTGEPQEPFLATRGFDSVMWSRLYSRAEYETGVERDQVPAGTMGLLSLCCVHAQSWFVLGT